MRGERLSCLLVDLEIQIFFVNSSKNCYSTINENKTKRINFGILNWNSKIIYHPKAHRINKEDPFPLVFNKIKIKEV